ncbi:DUF7341 domain-containing protein [Leucobacter sp. Z1108]|uniref:DUF7341 domain-containing protein n=1 Tax=Leucobacter sp. Z1108 TaxID=3439066 RepID=UPI003F31F5E6
MQELLKRLTTTHYIKIERDSAVLQNRVKVDPLIKQLREAIFGEDGRNGGSGESRSRLPLSAPALDLYNAIEERVSEVWVQRFQRVPGIEHVEELLAEWAEGLEPITFVMHTVARYDRATKTVVSELTSTTVLAFLMQIEQDIVNLLERPTTQVPVTGPCPAVGCFATTITRDIDGELVTRPTLEFTREQRSGRTISVSCRTCEAEWDESRFREFAEALGRAERLR